MDLRAATALPARPPLTLILALLLAAFGCASTGSGEREPYATLLIQNDGTATVNIYAVRTGGSRMRVGTVSPRSTAEFPLRLRMLSGTNELQLLIDPVGSPQDYPARSIAVDRGDVIELQVSSFVR